MVRDLINAFMNLDGGGWGPPGTTTRADVLDRLTATAVPVASTESSLLDPVLWHWE